MKPLTSVYREGAQHTGTTTFTKRELPSRFLLTQYYHSETTTNLALVKRASKQIGG